MPDHDNVYALLRYLSNKPESLVTEYFSHRHSSNEGVAVAAVDGTLDESHLSTDQIGSNISTDSKQKSHMTEVASIIDTDLDSQSKCQPMESADGEPNRIITVSNSKCPAADIGENKLDSEPKKPNQFDSKQGRGENETGDMSDKIDFPSVWTFARWQKLQEKYSWLCCRSGGLGCMAYALK